MTHRAHARNATRTARGEEDRRQPRKRPTRTRAARRQPPPGTRKRPRPGTPHEEVEHRANAARKRRTPKDGPRPGARTEAVRDGTDHPRGGDTRTGSRPEARDGRSTPRPGPPEPPAGPASRLTAGAAAATAAAGPRDGRRARQGQQRARHRPRSRASGTRSSSAAATSATRRTARERHPTRPDAHSPDVSERAHVTRVARQSRPRTGKARQIAVQHVSVRDAPTRPPRSTRRYAPA